MTASEFTKMSKEISWDRRDPIALPTKDKAQELARLAAAGDRAAYKQIFTLNRFGRMAVNDEELEVVNIIFDAFKNHRHFFE